EFTGATDDRRDVIVQLKELLVHARHFTEATESLTAVRKRDPMILDPEKSTHFRRDARPGNPSNRLQSLVDEHGADANPSRRGFVTYGLNQRAR
ncbi:MAG: hypothetical protein AAGJ83_03215, partial [Planctomycetota bacterium]